MKHVVPPVGILGDITPHLRQSPPLEREAKDGNKLTPHFLPELMTPLEQVTMTRTVAITGPVRVQASADATGKKRLSGARLDVG